MSEHDPHGFGAITTIEPDAFDQMGPRMEMQASALDMQPMVRTQTQYVTAMRVQKPRQLGNIMRNLATYAQQFGEEYYYSWDANTKDGKQEISGPTIKLANDLLMLYGNCAVEVDTAETKTHWIFKAIFLDLENGTQLTRLYQQRKSQTAGKKMDTDRQLDIAFQIGQSKATRNVIVNALRSFADYGVQQARQAIVDKIGNNLDFFRAKILERLEGYDLDIKRVNLLVGNPPDKWTARDMAQIIARIQAAQDGMANLDEQFPDLDRDAPDNLEENVPAAEEKDDAPKKKPAAKKAKAKAKPKPPPVKGKPKTADGAEAASTNRAKDEKPSEPTESEPASDQGDDQQAELDVQSDAEGTAPQKTVDPETGELTEVEQAAVDSIPGGDTNAFWNLVQREAEQAKTLDHLQVIEETYWSQIEAMGDLYVKQFEQIMKQLRKEVQEDLAN